jgi:pyrroloquinoline-quinone synthase
MADGFAVTTTSQAVDQIVAARSMLKHPFYQAWTEGKLSLDTLQFYAKQYFHHVVEFPRAVSAVHANCPDRDGRRMLAENLAEEEGIEAGKNDHATLWLHFAQGLGATTQAVESVAVNPETQNLIDTFRRLSRKSYAAGLGALYAYESQFPDIARTKIDGLCGYGVTDERTIRFFRVHEEADIEHSAVCRGLLDKLSGEERAEAEDGAAELAGALLTFLDGVERVAGHA